MLGLSKVKQRRRVSFYVSFFYSLVNRTISILFYPMYLPTPPRAWSRVQSACTYASNSSSSTSVVAPISLVAKGNALQHLPNALHQSNQVAYSRMVRGFGPCRTKAFATQTQTYSNANTHHLHRVHTVEYPFPNPMINQPNSLGGPFVNDVPNPDGCVSTTVRDQGALVCGTVANPCSNQLVVPNTGTKWKCAPSWCSNVPGSQILCWSDDIHPWYPRYRTTMSSSGNKFPVNYKLLTSAIHPVPPVLTYTSSDNTLSWTHTGPTYASRLRLQEDYETSTVWIQNAWTYVLPPAFQGTCWVTALLQHEESEASNVVHIP